MSETLRIVVPSESDPSRKYVVHALGDAAVCSCIGYATHGHCKHATGVMEIMAADREQEVTALAVRDEQPPPPIVADVPPTALLPTRSDLAAMAVIAEQAVQASGMIPAHIRTKEQALAVLLAGWELGLRPMTALRHVYVVNGKTEIETRAMVGIIRARHPAIQFSWPEYTHEAVTCVVQRPGQPETRVRYTLEDAKASGQTRKKRVQRDGSWVEIDGPWQLYQRDMLYAAATKRACRLACPDLINAIEGAMTTEAEAVSLTMPDADVRVLDDAPLSADIPADAYNEGDDAAALPPEVAGATAAAPDPKVREDIRALYKRAKGELSPEAVETIRAALIDAGALTEDNKSRLSQVDDDTAVRLRDMIRTTLDGEGPPADAAQQEALL